MNPEEQEFESLKKLLALKRHEQPPPGYFNDLPRKIWKRIETEDAQPSFWTRFIPAFALRPAVAYTFGLIVCGILVFGIGSALKSGDAPSPTIVHQQIEPLQLVPGVGLGMNQENKMMGPGKEVSSTNPIFNADSLYPGPTKLNPNDVAPVNYKQQP